MKVIFLDIDGVLNSTRSVLAKSVAQTPLQKASIERLGIIPYFAQYSIDTIDQVAVGLLNRLFLKETIHVVLSSSHRGFFQTELDGRKIEFGSEEHLDTLQLYLETLGLNCYLFDVTKQLYERRGLEVSEWLSRHPEVTHHVAVDDGADFEPEDCILVRTDPQSGLSAQNYYDITKHLVIHESTIIF